MEYHNKQTKKYCDMDNMRFIIFVPSSKLFFSCLVKQWQLVTLVVTEKGMLGETCFCFNDVGTCNVSKPFSCTGDFIICLF